MDIIKKADWKGCNKSVNMGINDISQTTDNYRYFVDIIKKASRQNIPRGYHTSYSCGLTTETNELYEDYKMPFKNYPFNSETGNRLCNEIAEKWQTLIESTDFTQHNRKGLRATLTAMQGDS